MRHAETVTFGGSGLDRVAHLRNQSDEIARHIAAGRAETIALWRGKPLVAAGTLDVLIRLPMDHPALADADEAPVLLGAGPDGTLIFAHELVRWEPPDLDEGEMALFVDPTEQNHPDVADASFAELRRIMTRLSARDAELAASARAVFNWHSTHGFCARCGAPSQISMAGWQRGCASCGAQHFPRTDPVVIMLITHGNSVLLGRSPGWPEGMYSLLAGFIEPGETMEAAVRREVEEESGIKVGPVSYLASQPWPFPSSLMLGCRGEALTSEIHLDPNELEDARWVSREEVLAGFAGQARDILPAREGAIAHFLLKNWLADTLE